MSARLVIVLLAVWPSAFASSQTSDPGALPLEDRELAALEAAGFEASESPVVGYLPDGDCARCHRQIARTYQTLGMARSFAAPGEAAWIEDFEAAPYFHAASRRYYQYQRRGDRLVLRRWQIAQDGKEILPLELEVDWILGSGSVSRTYLYATPSGEWFQLPLAWYTQGSHWAMAPGFDEERHLGPNRLVRRECTFCHNAYPTKGPPVDVRHQPHRMSDEPPRGIGCQRCHGPGARHVAAVQLGGSPSEVSDRIVNPARLAPSLARDVCLQCHFQSTPSIQRVRRFGRDDYDFRPGQALVDFMTLLDIELAEPTSPDDERDAGRFEINHHGYRLEQSPCFERDERLLLCTQCHDPHRKPAQQVTLRRTRATCLECHAATSDRVPSEPFFSEGRPTGVEAGAPDPATEEASADSTPRTATLLDPEHLALTDCSSCHMPRRRAEDVVHAVMTDHRIAVHRDDPERRLAVLGETDDDVADLVLLRPRVDPPTDDLYRAVAAVRAGSEAPIERLDELVAAMPDPPLEVLHDLARIRAMNGLAPGPVIEEALRRAPSDPTLLGLLGVQQATSGDLETARRTLLRATGLDPRRAEHWMNLGRLDLAAGDLVRSNRRLQRAVELRPNLPNAWHWLAVARRRAGDVESASAAALRALVLDPGSAELYVNVVELLRQLGRQEEASRYLRHGLAQLGNPEILRALESD